jgi:hypothetical protein
MALLCSSSLAAKMNVTGPSLSLSRKVVITSPLSSSSARYRLRNSAHLLGSCPNHRRNSVLGATSFSQRSIAAFSLFSPRG